MECCHLEAELRSLLAQERNLLLSVSLFIVFGAFIDVLLTILQHPINQSGKPMSHGGDGFRGAELAAQSAVLK